jgi:hypothetical protein
LRADSDAKQLDGRVGWGGGFEARAQIAVDGRVGCVRGNGFDTVVVQTGSRFEAEGRFWDAKLPIMGMDSTRWSHNQVRGWA